MINDGDVICVCTAETVVEPSSLLALIVAELCVLHDEATASMCASSWEALGGVVLPFQRASASSLRVTDVGRGIAVMCASTNRAPPHSTASQGTAVPRCARAAHG